MDDPPIFTLLMFAVGVTATIIGAAIIFACVMSNDKDRDRPIWPDFVPPFGVLLLIIDTLRACGKCPLAAATLGVGVGLCGLSLVLLNGS